jgi:GT2 family glycosyltransferase
MNQPNAGVNIILVDNASNDGSVELVQKKYPNVIIHSFQQNQGFAPALNQAVHAYESDWVCFLNNDMKVDKHWLTELMAAAESTQAPCIGSVLMDWDGNHIQMAHGRINWFGKGFEEQQTLSGEPYLVFFACGGAMMIRRDVFISSGGFDDDFFMIYEDVDLGWRLWLLGHRVVIAPKSRVYHLGHASLKQEDYARKAVYLERNSLATLYKNLDESSLSIVLPLAVQESHLRANAYSGYRSPFSYTPDGMHTVSGVQHFFHQLDEWREKRSNVQSLRKIGDQEIFNQFFHDPETLWAYCDDHYQRLHFPNTKQQIQSLFSIASNVLSS